MKLSWPGLRGEERRMKTGPNRKSRLSSRWRSEHWSISRISGSKKLEAGDRPMGTAVLDEEAVIRDISPNDQMYRSNASGYFLAGRSALDCIDCALQAAHKPRA